jgi:hypothetical protein
MNNELTKIQLNGQDCYNLLLRLREYLELKVEQIKVVEAAERKKKPLALFDNYADFLAALYADKHIITRLLKDLQKQTGIIINTEEAIDKI